MPPAINNEKTSQQLMAMKAHVLSPDYGSEFPVVGGMTSSNIKVEYKMDLTSSVQPITHEACFWATAITVVITYKPTIHIAKEYVPGSCRYTTTEKHERLHVNVDVISLNEYLPRIKNAAAAVVSQWRGMGPVQESRIDAVRDQMEKPLKETLERMTEELEKLRTVRQRQVDSREEYRYLSGACPQEK